MPKRSNAFQQLVFLVKEQVGKDAQVTESKMMTDRITGTNREVDVCVETTVSGHKITVSIECRDRSRRADVSWVEEMKAKHERLPTNLLVLVSRIGFTPEAFAVAKKYGIETLSFKTMNENAVERLFGDTGILWAKFYSLTATKVVVSVATVNDLPAENVHVAPDNTLHASDGTVVYSFLELVQDFLRSEWVARQLMAQGQVEHKGFEFRWQSPLDGNGNPFCLVKLEPRTIRPIELIRIQGSCRFDVSQFQLNHGLLGDTKVAWAYSTIHGKDATLVISEDEHGIKRFTIKAQE